MRLACAFMLATAVAAVRAQPPAPAATLDVVVDDSRLAAPLTAADFIVMESGRPLPVEAATLVQATADRTPLPAMHSEDDELTVAAQAQRIIGVYVDEYHLSDDRAFAEAKTALAAFVRDRLGPRDLVVVLKPLDSLVSIRLTADRVAAARVVERAVARQGDYTARSAFEQQFIAGAPARIDVARRQIAESALAALAAHLGRFPAGRKTLFVLTNGFPPAAESRPDEPGAGIDAVVRAANRARVAIYPIRPSSVAEGPLARAVATGGSALPLLSAMAGETTGLVIDGGSRMVSGLQQALADASRYYVLRVTPPGDAPPGGRFTSVNVTIRRPGVTARSRAGYTLLLPDDHARTFPTSSLPEGLKVPRRSSPLIRTWFGQAKGPDGYTRIGFVWEPAPRLPGSRGPAVTPARIRLSVTTMAGAPVFADAVGPSSGQVVAPPEERQQVTFDAPPGTLLVQIDVLDGAGRVIDHEVRDLMVGGFAGPVSFGTPAFYRARTAREVRALTGGGAADAPAPPAPAPVAAPVAARQFSRAEHLVVRVPVISAGGEPDVDARLQSRFGAALRDLPVTMRRESGLAAQVDLPLAALASGGYAIEFRARIGAGTAVDHVEFVVTP